MVKTKMKRIKALLFDKDGTLIDFEKTWTPIMFALAKRAAENDEKKAKELLKISGYDFERQRFDGNSLLASGSISEILKAWNPTLTFEKQQQEFAYCREFCTKEALKTVVAIDGMQMSLQCLSNMGFKLGIGTNDSEESARLNAEILGCVDMFDVILGCDSVVEPKPAGDQIVAFAKALGLQTNEVAMIGDNGVDMMAARNGRAGLAIAVLSGNGEREQLQPASDLVVNSIADLPELFQSI